MGMVGRHGVSGRGTWCGGAGVRVGRLMWWRSPRRTVRGICRDADGRMAVHDGVRRRTGERRRHALAISFDLVPQHLDLPAHILSCLLEVVNEVDGWRARRVQQGLTRGGLIWGTTHLW